MRARTLACVIALGAPLAGCGVSSHSSTSATSRAAVSATSTTTSSTSTVPQTPRADVLQFARAYGAYLDGQIRADQLTDISPAARAELGPSIPRGSRVGLVTVGAVTLAPLGSENEAFLHDGSHTLQVGVQIKRSGGHDVVVGVVAPDLDSILQKPGRATAPPAGSSAAEQAARTFLAGYLPWVYGHGKASAIAAIAPQLQRELKGRSLPQSPQAPNLNPKVVAIALQRAGRGWLAEANISDSERTYDLNLSVVKTHGTWEVSRVTEPS